MLINNSHKSKDGLDIASEDAITTANFTNDRGETKAVSIYGLQNENIDVHEVAQVVAMLGGQLAAEAVGLSPLDERPEDYPDRRERS